MDDLAKTRSVPRGIPKEKVHEKLLGAIPDYSYDELHSPDDPRKLRTSGTIGWVLVSAMHHPLGRG
jgi:hypothetical protein